MASWVKFHRSLRKGAKRAFPRSTRFIYLEIAEEAREHGGVLEIPPRVTITDALHDLLGGSRDEIALAVGESTSGDRPPHLLEPLVDGDEPMLKEVTKKGRRLLVVVNFEKWNSTKDDSTHRVRELRARRKLTQGGSLVYFLQRQSDQAIKIGWSDNVLDRAHNVSFEISEPLTILGAIDGGVQQERELHNRFGASRLTGEWFAPSDDLVAFIKDLEAHPLTGKQTGARETNRVTTRETSNGSRVTISPSSTLISSSSEGVQGETVKAIVDAMGKGADLWPEAAPAEVAKVAQDAAGAVEDPVNRAGAAEAPAVIREALARAREHKAKYPLADSAQMLARLARIVGWVLDEYRSGKRQRQSTGEGLAGTTIGAKVRRVERY